MEVLGLARGGGGAGACERSQRGRYIQPPLLLLTLLLLTVLLPPARMCTLLAGSSSSSSESRDLPKHNQHLETASAQQFVLENKYWIDLILKF